MKEIELKPCPFCGCEDVRIVPLYEDIWSVRCNDCSTQLRTLTLNDNQFLEQEGQPMKEQIEEMRKDLQKSEHWYFDDKSVDFELDRLKTAEALYNAGYRKQEWISVEDRLPEIAGKYLISRKTVYGNLINIVWYDTNYNGGNDDMIGKSVWYMFDGDWGDYEIPDVTHWMPLPEPPKMKGGAE